MKDEPEYILKEDKYTLSIIKKNKINNKAKIGISIFKKTLELNELNEDNINMIMKNSKKDEIIYSYANIGFISITGVICFAYCSEKDIKKIGEISFVKVYQVTNIRYIILDSDKEQEEKNEILKFFREYTRYEVNKGLIFSENLLKLDLSFDNFFNHIYDINTNICHLSPNLKFCYNNDLLAYFRKFELEDFISHLICGFYDCVTIKNKEKNDLTIHFIIKDLDLKSDEEKVKLDENKKVVKQIEIILTSNNLGLNQIFHFSFYCLIYDYINNFNNDKILYDILKKGQNKNKQDNGAMIFIDLKKITTKKNNKEINDITIDFGKNIKKEIGNNNKLIYIQKNQKIHELISNYKHTLNEIKYNYELKGMDHIIEFQEKALLVISDDENNALDMIESILLNIKYKYLDESGESLINNKIFENMKEIAKRCRNFYKTKSKNFKKMDKIYSEPVNEEYLNKYIFKENNTKKVEKKNDNDIINHENEEDMDKININEIIEKKGENALASGNENPEGKISVYIITNNVNCYRLGDDIDSENTLKKLLFPEIMKKRLSDYNLPTFYCIGLQEIVKLNTSNIIFSKNKDAIESWEKKISQMLQKNYNYTLQYREDLIGVLFLFFVKTSEAKHITDIKRTVKKSGFLNTLGNKGYIIYEFKYKKRTIAVCTGHLTSGEEDNKCQDRLDQLTDILSYRGGDNKSNRIFQNDFYFLFGDMNFRVKVNKKEFYDEINRINNPDNNNSRKSNNLKNNIASSDDNFKCNINNPRITSYNSADRININLEDEENIDDIVLLNKNKISETQFKNYFLEKHLETEELTLLKKDLVIFQINEHKIEFLPSYKYIKGYNYYNVTKIPSWTDRILFKDTRDIKCLCYDKIDVRYSDHRPVYALFELNINNK